MNDIIGIIVGVFFSFWLWMIWYSEFMFGKIWMIARGLPVEEIKEMEMPKYALLKGTWNAILVASIMTIAGKYFMFDNIQNYLILAVFGTLFVLSNEISKHIWEEEKISLLLVNVFFTLTLYVWMAAIVFFI